MPIDTSRPEYIDAIGRMDKKIYDEFRNLGYAGLSLDPARFLAFRKQTRNDKFMELVVSDAGVFFLDVARKIKFKFDPDYFLVYHDGLHAVEEEKTKAMQDPTIVLENLLEFWKKPGTGLCLVADHLNNLGFLSDSQKAELERVHTLYKGGGFTIRQMLHNKKTDKIPSAKVISLDD
jgi:hypothetical protein